MHCDLSDPGSIDEVIGALDAPFDGLGNIAGVAGSMGAELVLRVNVYGLRYLTESLLAAGRLNDGAGSSPASALGQWCRPAGRRWPVRRHDRGLGRQHSPTP